MDANVLIDAHRDYYPLDRVPEFWDWLHYQGTTGVVKIPLEIYEEIVDGADDLVDRLKQPQVKSGLVLEEEPLPAIVSRVVTAGYAADLSDDEILKVGRDPFLVAYALGDVNNRSVVTTEVSKPSRTRANRHLPDVCGTFGIASCNTFELVRRLNFTTRWRRPSA